MDIEENNSNNIGCLWIWYMQLKQSHSSPLLILCKIQCKVMLIKIDCLLLLSHVSLRPYHIDQQFWLMSWIVNNKVSFLGFLKKNPWKICIEFFLIKKELFDKYAWNDLKLTKVSRSF
jgi:hypothetical protein